MGQRASTLAPGEDGVANRTAQTAPKGAIVIETPLGANIWSIFPNNAIAAKAPIISNIRIQL